MSYNYYLFVLLLAITGCLLYIAYLAWRKREFPVALSLFFGMCGGAFYSFGYAFEIISSNLREIQFWLRIEYIGISFGAFLWFLMVLHYTGHRAFLRKWVVVLLALVPVTTLVSHYTNGWHHMFYRTMTISTTEGFPLASTTPGPFYILHVVYSYILVIIGMVLLVRMYRKQAPHNKKQVVFMIIGSCGPYVITLVYLSGLLGSPIDISPFGFLFSGVFFMWGIYQFNMMKLVPYALQKVFNSMKDAVIVLDPDHSITSFNQSASRLFNELKDRRVTGQQVDQVLFAYPELIDIMKQETSIQRKIKIISPTDLKHYQITISEINDKKENCIGKMVLLADITETVLAEEKLLAGSKQLFELNAFKDKMFAVVAHDIRDPLSILISLMEILNDEMQLSGNKHAEIATEMERQIQNTFTLVESLLDWFRSHESGIMFNPIVWNLAEAVQRNMDFLYIQSTRKRITIVSEISDDILIYADREMIDLILRNLLTNAIKFTDAGGCIYLCADQADDSVIISVRDSGSGIRPEQASRLLQDQKAYPASTPGTAGERGIGLGLTLCKDFVQINGGDIWFETSPDLGSTFYFSVPAPSRKYVQPV